MKKKSIDSFITIASWTRWLSWLVLLGSCFSSPGWGQEVKTAEIVDRPLVEEDRVTVRIKVTGTDDRPVVALEDTDFSLIVDDQPLEFRSKDWKSPEETIPPPAWIIVLLDYSGSMNQDDSRGTTKLEGAIAAIREFATTLADRGPNTQVAIVPFGDSGKNCPGYPVRAENLDKFIPAGDFKLMNYLDFLAREKPCASTNIYEPLTRAIRFFNEDSKDRFFLPEDSQEPKPRLAIILLSDGYHNKPREAEDFQKLLTLLKRDREIKVHTLGYGLTPAELGRKYGLGRPATRADIGRGEGEVPEEEFVDRDRLAEIAKATGGIAEFSPDALTVADKLEIFLNALLGEYEITYTEPNPERGSEHEVRVVVRDVESEPTSYRIAVFGRSLPLRVRLMAIACTFLTMGLGGVVPFWLWGQHLKFEALED